MTSSDDEHDRSDRGGVEEAEPGLRGPRRHDADEDSGGRGRHDRREHDPFSGEDAACEHVGHRDAGSLRHDGAAEQADDKPDRRPENCQSSRLGDGHERELPAARSVPGEPTPGREQVGAKRHRRQQREGEEQRGRLAADDAEPAPGRSGRRLRLPQLLDRGEQVERERAGLQLRARLRDVGGEIVDLPEPRRPGAERRHPGVAPEDAVERGRGSQRVDAFGQEERRRGRAVVAGRAGERRADLCLGERVVGRGQEVAEEDAVVEYRLPHLDEVQAVRMRQPTLAAKPQNLTALRRARARQPARPQRHPAVEVLDAAEPREGAGDGGLAEEDKRGRPCDSDRRKRVASPRVELRVRLLTQPREAEPDRADRALAVRDPLHRLRDGAVLRDKRSRAAADDDGGAGCDPEHDENDGRAAAAQPSADEAERIESGAEAPHAVERRTRSAATASRPSRRPTSSWRRASTGSRRPSTSSQVPSSRAAGSTASRSSGPGSGGSAQSACTSATSAAARSTEVAWSRIRISSVPSRGCGRASHQIRV